MRKRFSESEIINLLRAIEVKISEGLVGLSRQVQSRGMMTSDIASCVKRHATTVEGQVACGCQDMCNN